MGAFAGTYKGTFSGADSGTWTVSVTSAGVLTGSGALADLSETFSIVGLVQPNGALSMTSKGVAGSGTFTGSISASGALTGTWAYVAPGVGSGTFAGQKQ